MENKINVAELLKDCPKGMELDCTTFNNVKFQCADNDGIWIEYIDSDNNNRVIYLTCEGGIKIKNIETKCIIFPKGKTTWEGFQRPFVDGDILSYQFAGFRNRSIYIYKYHPRLNTSYYVALSGNDLELMVSPKAGCALHGNDTTVRFATEEEKQQLFDAIKANGYKWNPDNKSLEKLIKPMFKVGDRIRNKKTFDRFKITSIDEDSYYCGLNTFYICDQDQYELILDKFDITTLVPFESKVLARDYDVQIWIPTFWGKYLKDVSNSNYLTTSGCYKYCIPYEGNEHLLGTTDDCDEYFKTWE